MYTNCVDVKNSKRFAKLFYILFIYRALNECTIFLFSFLIQWNWIEIDIKKQKKKTIFFLLKKTHRNFFLWKRAHAFSRTQMRFDSLGLFVRLFLLFAWSSLNYSIFPTFFLLFFSTKLITSLKFKIWLCEKKHRFNHFFTISYKALKALSERVRERENFPWLSCKLHCWHQWSIESMVLLANLMRFEIRNETKPTQQMNEANEWYSFGSQYECWLFSLDFFFLSSRSNSIWIKFINRKSDAS